MKGVASKYVLILLVLLTLAGCNGLFGPDRTGEIHLSSQLFGNETYYLFGYSFEHGDFFRYPFQSEPVPDIINEAFRVLLDGDVTLVPGFNIPAQMNGFALVGEFGTIEEARDYYNDYSKVEASLQLETISDTVQLNQVWVQKTEAGNYVKFLIKDIQNYEDEGGALYNEVIMDYTDQPDGSTTFPK